MSTELLVGSLRNQIFETYKERLNLFQSMCESPIEEIFLLNFINYYESEFRELVEVSYLYDFPEILTNGEIVLNKKSGFVYSSMGYTIPQAIKIVKTGLSIILTPQVTIEFNNIKYRADFLLIVTRSDNSEKKICIECDGYDFHQKTKEQVTRDNQRDRDIMTNGYIVFRYSGSEIYTKSSKNYFKELMTQIERAVVHDLIEKEKLKEAEFFKKYVSENHLDDITADKLKKLLL